MGPGCGGDNQIVGPDDLAAISQTCPYRGVLTRRTKIEREDLHLGQHRGYELLSGRSLRFRVGAMIAMEKLGHGDRGYSQLCPGLDLLEGVGDETPPLGRYQYARVHHEDPTHLELSLPSRRRQIAKYIVDFLEVICKLAVGTRQALPEFSEVVSRDGLPATHRLDPAHGFAIPLHDEGLAAILDPIQDLSERAGCAGS